MKRLLLFSLLGAGSLPAGLAQEWSPQVGEPFPLLLFPSLEDGRPLSLADFRGEKLILHIWASW